MTGFAVQDINIAGILAGGQYTGFLRQVNVFRFPYRAFSLR